MAERLRILIASRSLPALRAIAEHLEGRPEFECATRHISNGHIDPLYGLTALPDVLLLRFDQEHLAALAESASSSRPPLIVVGPPGNAEAMRLAIRSGAKDFLAEPIDVEELLAALARIRREARAEAERIGSIDMVIGAAGGVGTSFIACNLARAAAAPADSSCLLLDLDVNYAPLTHFLDLEPERGLLEALDALESLDEHALQGHVSKHRSGLHLMTTVPRPATLAHDLDAGRLAQLLQLLTTHYRHIVVDSPHYIDATTATALGMARNVLIVLQQSVLHVKNAGRLLAILTRELGVPRERIRLILNRYGKRSTVQPDDVRRTLEVSRIVTVPSQYALALDSIDTATPLLDLAREAPVTRSLLDLQAELAGTPRTERTGVLGRLPLFVRRGT